MSVQTKLENKKRVASMKQLHRKDNLMLWSLAIPGIIFLLLFNYIPMYGLKIAFVNFIPVKGMDGSAWNDFQNFRFFFDSIDAKRILRNTVLYSTSFIALDIVAGLAVGIALFNLKNNFARKVYNTIMILPRFLSMVLIAYVVYGLISHNGVINNLLESWGIDRISFYTEPGYWPIILAIVHVWAKVGMGSIMYLAHLSGLDTGLVEAARLDGANGWQVVWHVYLPHLRPIISVLLILSVGSIFGGDFGLFYQIPMDKGALYETTDIINTYVYRGMMQGNYGVSAAIGLLQSAAGCIMVVIANLVIRKISPENSMF